MLYDLSDAESKDDDVYEIIAFKSQMVFYVLYSH